MPFSFYFQVSTYLLVLNGFLSLGLTHELSPLSMVLVLIGIALSWRSPELWASSSTFRSLMQFLPFTFLVFAVSDILFLADSFITGVIHLLVLLGLYKLYTRRSNRDYIDIYIISFFQLVAASALTTSLAFLIPFLAFIVLGTWTFILFHLNGEIKRSGSEPSQMDKALGISFFLPSLGVAILSFALTISIFLLIPRIGRAYLPFKSRIGTLVTGFSDKVELGAFGSIQTDPTIVMRVRVSGLSSPEHIEKLYWRGVAFESFDGKSWFSRDRQRWTIIRNSEGIFPVGTPRVELNVIEQEIYLEPIESEFLFAAPRLLGVSADFPALLINGTRSISAPGLLSRRTRYIAYSQPEAFSEEELKGEGSQYPTPIRQTYLQLPVLPERVIQLAESLSTGAHSPYEKVKRVESYLLENYRYTLDLKRDPRYEPIEDFLFVEREGNCEYFAAAMAVLLRQMGIPSRVVNGFQRGEWNEVGQYFAVRQRDAHSWVEVYFPRAGWVTFDPSPRQTFEGRAGIKGMGFVSKYLDWLRMRWNRYVIDYNLGDQIILATTLKRRSEALGDRLLKGLKGLWGFISLKGVKVSLKDPKPLALFFVLLILFLFFRKRGPQVLSFFNRRGPIGKDSFRVAFYERMLRVMARGGIIKKDTETPLEFSHRITLERGIKEAEEITRIYYRVRYGREALKREEEVRIESLLNQIKKWSELRCPKSGSDDHGLWTTFDS